MAIISVKNLSKKYGDFQAVDDISFDVARGSIFGLLGSNGAGKTTTLEIIETLKTKDLGSVRIDGWDLDKNASEIKKIIGVQLQASGYFPNLNLLELIDLFSGIYGIKVDANQILKSVNLADKSKNKFKELSGGQKQRFSIATTIIHQPKIVFLDEPTTGLDPKARRELWDQILEMKAAGTTIVITTHYLDEAEYLCDEVAIMDKGKIIKQGTPSSMIEELLATGYESKQVRKALSLEDVFIAITGKETI